MTGGLWSGAPLPDLDPGAVTVFSGPLARLSDLTAARQRVGELVSGSGPGSGSRPIAGRDDAERLLLAFEELSSNGLRHGGAPVHVSVMADGNGWLIDVTDSSVHAPPSPAIDRDPAYGGLGLHLVARLCAGHGWFVQGGRKHVWACIARDPGAGGASRASGTAG